MNTMASAVNVGISFPEYLRLNRNENEINFMCQSLSDEGVGFPDDLDDILALLGPQQTDADLLERMDYFSQQLEYTGNILRAMCSDYHDLVKLAISVGEPICHVSLELRSGRQIEGSYYEKKGMVYVVHKGRTSTLAHTDDRPTRVIAEMLLASMTTRKRVKPKSRELEDSLVDTAEHKTPDTQDSRFDR